MKFVLIIIIILLLIYLIMKYSINNENFVTYTKCKKFPETHKKKIITDIYKKYNINFQKDNSKKWDIYHLCGYKNIEDQLAKIKVHNNKQIIFAINGCDKISHKNTLWTILNNYYGRDESKKIMPESFILDSKEDIDLFKSKFHPKKMYVIKKNLQRKKGIKLSNNLDEIINIDKAFKVVQEFIIDTYLINNRVLNLRIYLMIICKNNEVSFYLHKLGKCLYSAKDINSDLSDFDSRITNSYKTTLDIYNNNPLTLDELNKYLNKKKPKSSTVLFNNIQNIFKKLCNAIKHHIKSSPNLLNNITTQLFGVDVIFGKNMKPYILEFNKGPDMEPKDDKDYNIKYKVELDMLEKLKLIKVNDIGYTNDFRIINL